MKLKTYILTFSWVVVALGVTTSCDDMLDKGNDYVIYSDDHKLVNPADTVTSVMGILNKLQGIAIRTNLLGEVRADLVVVNDNATSDLKELAELSVSDDNQYNLPRDYYAVINNCNYYLANVDSTAGNANRNEKYFEKEIAQVHSIRAWTYLQLALVYGKVPFVTEPVITKLQSEEQYPMYDITQICDYFIDDLKPYYGKPYPEYTNIGDDIDPKMCFFPTQVVTADLYLWKAVVTQDKEMAKQAAKSYYDYIMWDLNGKSNLYTDINRFYWSGQSLYADQYLSPSSTTLSSTIWGRLHCEDITKIPMDSASADGYYNELRNLYNTTNHTELIEASISPSDIIKSLSRSQTYVDYDTYRNVVEVTPDKFTDEQVEKGYVGDLRYQHNYYERTQKYNSKEYDFQYISKHNSQHISIYRTSQLYLRLAEALNYAGYPRFAKQILTMGLSNNVISNEVAPYYVNTSDSAFIAYFNFNNNDFLPYAQSYTLNTNEYGIVESVTPVITSSTHVNTLGIHSRGSGMAFLNENYAPVAPIDSIATNYPFELQEAIPELPIKPEEVAKPADTPLTFEEWAEIARGTKDEEHYNSNYYNKYLDSVTVYNQYLTDMATYNEELERYETALNEFLSAYQTWYKAVYSSPEFIETEQKQIDQLILDEQALEMCYEGNRYYDLMRRAYWWDDASKLVNPISKRTSAASQLNDRSKWFLNWKNKIGF